MYIYTHSDLLIHSLSFWYPTFSLFARGPSQERRKSVAFLKPRARVDSISVAPKPVQIHEKHTDDTPSVEMVELRRELALVKQTCVYASLIPR